MHEILRHLQPEDFVLDLGCRHGSFDAGATSATVIRLDLDPAPLRNAVAADARHLPFRDGAFQAVIANHSLEHIEGLEQTLREIGRVAASAAAIYISVPDASTLCDRLYRWLARGGGHVNAITDPDSFARDIERGTGKPVFAQRTLHTSYSYLNRHNLETLSLKMRLLGGGRESVLRAAQRAFAWADRRFGTRLTIYGWAFFAGATALPIDGHPRRNVCIRCGAGHETNSVAAIAGNQNYYPCPNCRTRNYLVRDCLVRDRLARD